MIDRVKDSHKGQNGRICVIGGNARFHGAPIFAALGAEASGVDLIYPVVPPCHAEVTKHASYNFICEYFKLNYLTGIDLFKINKVVNEVDAVVIGPGLGDKSMTINTINDVIQKVSVPLVIDASGLYIIENILENDEILPPHTVLTPHRHEFEKITGETLTSSVTKNKQIVQEVAQRLECIILLKGEKDILCNAEDSIVINRLGNPGLTVGGSGDVLSRLIGGLIVQGVLPFEACQMAIKIMGQCGQQLFKEKGYGYTALDVIKNIPPFLLPFTT